MKVNITKPIRVKAISGEVEVDPQELNRLMVLNACELIDKRESPEKPSVEPIEKKETKKKKK